MSQEKRDAAVGSNNQDAGASLSGDCTIAVAKYLDDKHDDALGRDSDNDAPAIEDRPVNAAENLLAEEDNTAHVVHCAAAAATSVSASSIQPSIESIGQTATVAADTEYKIEEEAPDGSGELTGDKDKLTVFKVDGDATESELAWKQYVYQGLKEYSEDSDDGSNEDDDDEDDDCGESSEEEEDEKSVKNEATVQEIRRKNRGRPSSCVFVASLSAAHTDDQLCNSVEEHFKNWGEIALVKVLRDPNNRPYAFVQYNSDEAANAALTGAQHSTLNDRIIRVEPARVNRTLYVTPLKDSLTDEQNVMQYLSKFGEVEQLVHTKNALGSYKKANNWFVKFAYRDDAIRAFASLRIDRDWAAEWAQNLDTPGAGYNSIDKQSIFIGQLDHRATQDKIVERFGKHGDIVECNLVIRQPDIKYDGHGNAHQRNNSFSFVKFDSEEAAAEAVEQENHTVFMDKTMHVQYRELNHHTQQNKNSSENKLNLAPPPISLPKYGGSMSAGHPAMNQRVNARHSSLPVTPLPGYKNRSGAVGQHPKWRVSSMRQGYPSSHNQDFAPPRGSSPYSSSPSTSLSPSSAQQSPQSPSSSTSATTSPWNGYGGGRKRPDSVAVSPNNLYSPPHKREDYAPHRQSPLGQGGNYCRKNLYDRGYNTYAQAATAPSNNPKGSSGKFQAKSMNFERTFVPRGNSVYQPSVGKRYDQPQPQPQQQQQQQPQPRPTQLSPNQNPVPNQPPPPSASGNNGAVNMENFYPPAMPVMGVPQYFSYDGGMVYPPTYYYGYPTHYPVPAPAQQQQLPPPPPPPPPQHSQGQK